MRIAELKYNPQSWEEILAEIVVTFRLDGTKFITKSSHS